MIERHVLKLANIRYFILYDSDEMHHLASRIGSMTSSSAYSRPPCHSKSWTWLGSVSFMRDPIRILVKKEELTLGGIKQFYIAIDREEWKLDTLRS